jgi:hypothetical protein
VKKALESISFFFHPIPLLAVAIMALNDHYLKMAYPGMITGKLSDFMGVFYFPIFLCALVMLAQASLQGESARLTLRLIVCSILFTDAIMIALKLSSGFTLFIENFFARFLFEIRIWNDPTDLFALTMNELTFFYLWRWMKRPA